ETDDAGLPLRPFGVERTYTPHGFGSAMATPATGSAAGRLGPETFAELDPEHTGIGEIVVLKCPRLGQKEIVAGHRRVLRLCDTPKHHDEDCGKGFHVTVSVASARVVSPCWSIHVNSTLPVRTA